jgi:hypothetical protein
MLKPQAVKALPEHYIGIRVQNQVSVHLRHQQERPERGGTQQTRRDVQFSSYSETGGARLCIPSQIPHDQWQVQPHVSSML